MDLTSRMVDYGCLEYSYNKSVCQSVGLLAFVWLDIPNRD